MFRKAKNIDETYRHIRLFTIVVVCGAIALCCFTLHKSYQAVKAAESRVYVLSSGKVLEAYASQRSENTAIEARDHIENFHRLFFSLDPDEKSIESTISKALYLADGSAKKNSMMICASLAITQALFQAISASRSRSTLLVLTRRFTPTLSDAMPVSASYGRQAL